MFDDEEQKPRFFEPKILEPLSLEELDLYIEALNEEADRCREAIESKKNQRGAADALFSRPKL